MTLRAKTMTALIAAIATIGILSGCGGSSEPTTTETPVVVPSTTGGIPSPPVFDPLPSPQPLITPTPSPSPT